MSLQTEVQKSSAPFRVLVEIDLGDLNTQWVNIGAGIWMVDAENEYTFVDSSLLDGFTAQGFGAIGSVSADGIPLDHVASIAELYAGTWYYDGTTGSLYICNRGYDEPFIHQMIIGVLTGYTTFGFAPTDGPGYYEGRLERIPTVSRKRDPLFYGRISYGGATITLANGDGALDAWGAGTILYGQDARILFGSEDLAYTEYAKIFAGYVQSMKIGERQVTLSIQDKRKQLTRPITYSCTDKNALDAIAEILNDYYDRTYDSFFYDLASWEEARAEAGNVTIDMQEPEPAIDVIEDIAASVFGIFYVDAEGKYAFKIVDEEESIDRYIDHFDIFNAHDVSYDPTQVVSSVRIGYAKDWTTTSNPYTYLTDTSREVSAYTLYKTYNQRTFETMLAAEADAQAFATRVLDYAAEVRGVEQITVPIENYDLTLGTQIGAVIQRGDQPMIGELKAEVTGIDYLLDAPAVRLTIRHGGAIEPFLTAEDESILRTEDAALIMED